VAVASGSPASLRVPTVLPDDQKVWRYMSFSRFVWLLQFKQLWMSRSDLLGDPWEMALAGDQLAHVLSTHPPSSISNHQPETETALERAERVTKAWRQMTFVNCWCASEHESHALWRIYCPPAEGVAIQTTLGRLRQSVGGLPVHRVTYDVPGRSRQTPSLTDLVTKKRPMFAYENEVRIVLKSGWKDDAHPTAITVGLGLDWDPETTLADIWVHPDSDYSFSQTVTKVVEQLAPNLKRNVWYSEMSTRPPF
jgi:hypothetical protein